MTTLIEQIQKIIEKAIDDAKHSSYQKGWDDAIASMTAAAAKMGNSATAAPKAVDNARKSKKTKRLVLRAKRGKAQRYVLTAIEHNPGRTGTEIAGLVAKDGVNKHTVRTCIRRLRIDGEIEQRGKQWFRKNSAKEAA